MAFIIPITLHPPHLSYFISSIFSEGLIEIPPVSNVTAFPTTTIGFSFLVDPEYSITIRFGVLELPLPTARIPPNPYVSISSFLITLTLIFEFADNFSEKLARTFGEQSFGGKLLMSRVNITASDITEVDLIIF